VRRKRVHLALPDPDRVAALFDLASVGRALESFQRFHDEFNGPVLMPLTRDTNLR
jgi:hypothetical protein